MSIQIEAFITHVDYDQDNTARRIVIHPVKPPPAELALVIGKKVTLVVMEGGATETTQTTESKERQ
jgi:hypothetical protein